MLVLTAAGVASIVVFSSDAPGLLKLVPDSDESAIDSVTEKLAKAVRDEVKSINVSKKQYNTRLNGEIIQESVRPYFPSHQNCLISLIIHHMHISLDQLLQA